MRRLITTGVLALSAFSGAGCATQAAPPTASPTVPTRFNTIDEGVSALVENGIPCSGASGSARQQSCSDEVNLTLWATNDEAVSKARANVALFAGVSDGATFIVFRNAMLAVPTADAKPYAEKLKAYEPTVIDTP